MQPTAPRFKYFSVFVFTVGNTSRVTADMSIIKHSKYGYFISHKALIDEIYSTVDTPETSFQLKPQLFNIAAPYKPPKSKHKKTKNPDDPFESEVFIYNESITIDTK